MDIASNRCPVRFIIFSILIGTTLFGCAPREALGPRWSDTCVVHPEEMTRAEVEFNLRKTPPLASPPLRAAISASLQGDDSSTEPLIIGSWCYFLTVRSFGAFPSLERAHRNSNSCATEHEVLYTPPHTPGSEYGKIEGLRIDPLSDRVALLLATEEGGHHLLAVVDPRIRSSPIVIDRGPVEGVEWMDAGKGLAFTSPLKGRAAVVHVISLIDRLTSIESTPASVVYRSFDETEVLSLRRDAHLAEVVLTIDSPLTTREMLVSERGIVALDSPRSQRRFTVWRPSGRATLVKSYETGETWIELLRDQEVTRVKPPPHNAFREMRAIRDLLYVVSSSTKGDQLTVFNGEGKGERTFRPSTVAHRFTLSPAAHDLDEDAMVSEESFVTPSSPFPLKQKSRPSDISARIQTVLSRDGTPIPVTLIEVTQSTDSRTPHPTFVTGYGAYGALAASRYAPIARTLLERGWKIAIVHVRGGGELGPAWHLNGRGERKSVSVSDFLDGASAVRRGDFGTHGPVVWYGKSAGGTLVAAAALQNPKLADGVIIDSGFLDINSVLGTHRDRMSFRERDEWGFPSSIDPCSLAIPETMPPLLIVAGAQDTVVPAQHAVGFRNRILRTCPSCQATLVLSSTGTHRGERYKESEAQMLLTVAQFAQSVSLSYFP